jgi:antitoxin component YwqK of YwqJK toxin-antitoxin module
MEWLKHLVIRNNGECIVVNGQYQGLCYERNPNGTLASEAHYINSVLRGNYYHWYNNGNIMGITEYISGKMYRRKVGYYSHCELSKWRYVQTKTQI